VNRAVFHAGLLRKYLQNASRVILAGGAAIRIEGRPAARLGALAQSCRHHVAPSRWDVRAGRSLRAAWYASRDEVARAALFLASDDSSFATGIELFVDGGRAQI